METEALKVYQDSKMNMLKVAKDFSRTHFKYGTQEVSLKEGKLKFNLYLAYCPQSINQDYEDFGKQYLKKIKANSVAGLKVNRIKKGLLSSQIDTQKF